MVVQVVEVVKKAKKFVFPTRERETIIILLSYLLSTCSGLIGFLPASVLVPKKAFPETSPLPPLSPRHRLDSPSITRERRL
jgi:hypothetical protein